MLDMGVGVLHRTDLFLTEAYQFEQVFQGQDHGEVRCPAYVRKDSTVGIGKWESL